MEPRWIIRGNGCRDPQHPWFEHTGQRTSFSRTVDLMDCSLEPLQCSPDDPCLNQHCNEFRANLRSHDSHGRRFHFIEVLCSHSTLSILLNPATSPYRYWQEMKSMVQALKLVKSIMTRVRVIRRVNSIPQEIEIDLRHIVPGDVVAVASTPFHTRNV